MRRIYLLLACLLSNLAWAEGNINQHTEGDCSPAIIAKGNVAVKCKVVINMYRSADYRALEEEIKRAEGRVKRYPDSSQFQLDLKEARERLEKFKQGVQELRDTFERLPINTERLRLAKRYFEEGNYQAARDVLDERELLAEQAELLKRKQALAQHSQDIDEKLRQNAEAQKLCRQLGVIQEVAQK